MHGTLTERITRSLAYMLRHQPEEFDLELDEGGWAEMEEVVCALNERLGEPIEVEDVMDALDGGDRKRYEIVGEKIRALYGHSFYVDPGEPVEPPELLYAGVGSRDGQRAGQHGLKPFRRSFVHLALTEAEAIEAGRRAAPEYVVLTIEAGEAWEEGIEFYDRGALFLSEEIPAEFIDVGPLRTDGIVRPRAGGRGPRGGGSRRGGGRGSYHRDREDRGGDRDERPARAERSQRDDRPVREERPKREETSVREERPAREARPAREERPHTSDRLRPEAKRSSAAPSGGGTDFGAGLS